MHLMVCCLLFLLILHVEMVVLSSLEVLCDDDGSGGSPLHLPVTTRRGGLRASIDDESLRRLEHV